MNSPSATPVPSAPTSSGWQYAVRILIGCVIVWLIFGRLHDPNPLWALISVIIVTEPDLSAAFAAFNSRVVNTLIGCAVGLALLYVLGASYCSILFGIIVSVIISTKFIRIPGSWRVAPVTVVILMVPTVSGMDRHAELMIGINRMEEVLLGSAVALLITYASSMIHRFFRSYIV